MSLALFLETLTGKIYKILPLKESSDSGSNVHISEYVASLLIEIVGACDTFPQLKEYAGYLGIVNTIQYISQHNISVKVCKREVFKMLRLLEDIEKQIGGGSV